MAVIQGNAHKSSVSGFYPKTINGSLRFNKDDASLLTLTPNSAGSRTTWTYSTWVKLSVLPSSSSNDTYLITSASGSTETTTYINGINGRIEFYHYNGSGFDFLVKTNNFLRDPSAWYHLVIVLDTTNATASERQRIYINGVAVTSWDTQSNSSQNFANGLINNTTTQNIGGFNGTGKFDGYMAEVHFTDGTAYDADAFGELKEGVWVAKAPDVTYGTNGFYLDFANSADIGNDVSGEGNDWTPNNFTASDVVLDSPTDNFCTLNPLDKDSSFILSDGNLRGTRTSTTYSGARSTIQIPETGKWYFEAEIGDVTGGSNVVLFGVCDKAKSMASSLQSTSGFYGWTLGGNQNINDDGSNDQVVAGSSASGTIMQIAINKDDGEIYLGLNNTWYEKDGTTDSNPSAGTNPAITSISSSYELFPVLMAFVNNGLINFGQQDFAYTPPTDYLALSTANLPDPAIDPAQGSSPEDYFGISLWSGNNGTQSITDLSFQPDFVWGKKRGATVSNHSLFDAVRGVQKVVFSDLTGSEETQTGITSFDSNGFTMGSWGGLNSSGTYVGWSWKANGSGVSNTDGSITSTVSANTESGFSIVSYEGTGVAGETIGHGLTQAPDMMIIKNRNYPTGDNWVVYHSANTSEPETEYLWLNTTDATADNSSYWNDTAPTSSVFTVGANGRVNRGTSGYTFIAYCFHSVDGFSKAFSYTGNGSSDGSFIYCGFQPAFLMIKRTDTTSNWVMYDNHRDSYNLVTQQLLPNDSGAEQVTSTGALDLISNGVKLRGSGGGINASGGTYIGIAFASNPFKYSTAR